jgi:hypothetical protein
MGASASTNVTTTTTNNMVDAVTNAIVKNQASCAASSVQNQNMSIAVLDGNVGSIDQTASATVNASCLQSSQNDANMQAQLNTALKSAIDQAAQANPTIGLNVASNYASSIQNNLTKLQTNFDLENIKSCVAKSQQSQNLDIGLVKSTANIGSISQNLTSDVIAQCVQADANTMSDIKALTTDMTAGVTQSAISGIPTTVLIAAIIACVICVIAVAYMAPSILNALG